METSEALRKKKNEVSRLFGNFGMDKNTIVKLPMSSEEFQNDFLESWQ